MPRLPRLTASEAETLVLKAGFRLLRSEGHRIYGNGRIRVVIPFHAGKILHPKIVKQILKAINDANESC